MVLNPNTFQNMLLALQQYWASMGCTLMQPLDMEMGAGTFHPATFLRAIGPEPWRAAYIQACRRPTDGRYGKNPNRLQHYYQFQVALKPSPDNIQDLYLNSLRALGIDPLTDDIRFIEGNWEAPTLGSWGLGWEVWQNSMEISQFTYFQQVGGLACHPVMGEITYGLERIAMHLQNIDNIYDLIWNHGPSGVVTYGDLFLQNEQEFSAYHFELADVPQLFTQFEVYEQECARLLATTHPLPAYEMVIKASHVFNILDARHAISVTERQRFMLRIRKLAHQIAQSYYEKREELGFPLCTGAPHPPPLAATSPLRGEVKNSMASAPPPSLLPLRGRWLAEPDVGRMRDIQTLSNTSQMGEIKSSNDLLIELGTEELPPLSLQKLAHGFAESLSKALHTAGFPHQSITEFASPRRLAIIIHHMASTQNEQHIERRGPLVSKAYDSDNKPNTLALGFAKSCGIDVKQLSTTKSDKGDCLYFSQVTPGQPLATLLPALIQTALASLPITKPMRWGDHPYLFARPLRWVVILHGETPIPGDIFGIPAGSTTYGHRFHHPEAIPLKKATDYVDTLEKTGHVIVDFATRRTLIKKQIIEAAKTRGHAVIEEAMLNEVTAMVELPHALLGSFSSDFLDLPPEVLISVMQVHQKCFHIQDAVGKLLPYFIIISNIESKNPAHVILDNERVMHARLSDAQFFYDLDKKQTLDTQLEKLKHVIFQNKLGHLGDKASRIEKLAGQLADKIGADKTLAKRAGLLAKTDLVSDMVGEFPELNGIMGYYYAKQAGEPEAVCLAIKAHYFPRFASDSLPPTDLGCLVSLADRLDTLVGLFSIKQTPTGDKDPFALRRTAIGLLRIIIEKKYALDLRELIDMAIHHYPAEFASININQQILDFIIERLRAWYIDQHVTPDIFAAVHASCPTKLLDFDARIQAVKAFVASLASKSLASANKRVSNLLKRQTPSSIYTHPPKAALFTEDAERELASLLNQKTKAVAPLYTAGNYTDVLKSLSDLEPAIDVFFTEVMVMVDDEALRTNRLALLNQLYQLFSQVADISLLQE